MTPLLRLLLAAVLSLAALSLRAAEHVSIAAAANLVYALGPLEAAFSHRHPGVTVTRSIGASGSLVAQIEQGAPYDVFLSADLDYPQKLVARGGAESSSFRTFAYGRLVLWTTRPHLELKSVESAIRNPSVHRIAEANPRTAPYGAAAEEVLARLGLAAAARPKIVTGENISQTAQFVATGNADLGFVALSLVIAPQANVRGHWIAVPAQLYHPIAQGAVLTKRGAANPAARRFLEFLSSPEAGEVLQRFGYGLPGSVK